MEDNQGSVGLFIIGVSGVSSCVDDGLVESSRGIELYQSLRVIRRGGMVSRFRERKEGRGSGGCG